MLYAALVGVRTRALPCVYGRSCCCRGQVVDKGRVDSRRAPHRELTPSSPRAADGGPGELYPTLVSYLAATAAAAHRNRGRHAISHLLKQHTAAAKFRTSTTHYPLRFLSQAVCE